MQPTPTFTIGTDTTTSTRWVGVGSSVVPEPAEAVREALGTALAGEDPKLCVAFCSTAYDLDAVARELRAHLGAAELIGCSTAGEVATAGPTESGLALWVLGGDGVDVATGYGVGSPASLRAAASEAARCAERVEPRANSVLVVLADGLCGDQMEVVRGAYEVAGAALPLVGGCAGDDLAMQVTRQLCGDQVLTNAVVAAVITSDGPIGIGVAHGWEPHGQPMLVTESRGVSVVTLDDCPALDAYLDAFGAPAEVRRDRAAFTRFASTRPLGLRRRDRVEIRYVAGADFDGRTLQCIAEVPQGGPVWLMHGDADTVLHATDAACAAALAPLDGRRPLGLLVFDCVARRSVLDGPGTHLEVERVAAAAGGAPVAGFYTYGEIARLRGAGGFHNQTLVVLALA
jgi:hypothetical protein